MKITDMLRNPERIRFPEEACAFAYGYTCYDCMYLNPYDRDRDGWVWCGALSRYLADTDHPCYRRVTRK